MHSVVRHMLKTEGFEINIIVATAGVAILSEIRFSGSSGHIPSYGLSSWMARFAWVALR